jgi:hypothetical protein
MAAASRSRFVPTQQIIEAVKAAKQRDPRPSNLSLAKEFGCSEGSISGILRNKVTPVAERGEPEKATSVDTQFGDKSGSLNMRATYPDDDPPEWLDGQPRSMSVHSLPKALKAAKVDTDTWQVKSWGVTFSEVTTKLGRGQDAKGRWQKDVPKTYTNCHLWVKLEPKSPEIKAAESILAEIRANSRIIQHVKPPRRRKRSSSRHLEISMVDPHLGLRCHRPGADRAWTLEQGKTMFQAVTRDLLKLAAVYGPFERVVWVFGNDYLHADNVFHTTTQGTPQPEAEAWQHVYVEGEKLAIGTVDTLLEVAPLDIYVIPGNHDRQTSFTLGRLLHAYYHANKHVTVHADASPYKFHHHGVNLIGFEHGHSIRQQARLAALMANECRDIWSKTSYREWHLGDQHRKGSAKPSMLEEQGVSVEYLPGLTPPNEWHRLKSYNWQKRAGMAFIWDKRAGLLSRLNVNIDSYTGQIMGTA